MLIIKAYENLNIIDEIKILNTGKKTKNGRTIYKILMPEGYENKKIYHYRKNGWKELTKKALKVITGKRK